MSNTIKETITSAPPTTQQTEHRFGAVHIFNSKQHTDKDVLDAPNLNDTVVLMFTASWCGPCQRITPQYMQFAAQNTKVAFHKVDVDVFPEAAQNFEIAAMPTFVFFNKGQEVGRVRGGSAAALQSNIEILLQIAAAAAAPKTRLQKSSSLLEKYAL